MPDVKRLAEEAGQRAALAMGKDAMRRAVEDLTLSAEEKAAREAARTREHKLFLLKLGAGGIALLVVGVAVAGALAKLWMYALGLLAVAAAGGAGYLVVKPRIAALRARATARLEAGKQAEAQARARRDAEERARVEAEKAAAAQQKIDDELAALKRRAQG